MKVRDVMIYDISAVFEDDTVERAVDIMSRQLVSGVPVVDEDMRVVGFISETDIMKASIPSYFSLLQSASFLPDANQLVRNISRIKDHKVSEYMSKPPITVEPSAPLIHAADLMIRHGIKTIPVVDENRRLIGVVVKIDILRLALKGGLE
jgi:CBS domain-containing protein